jgi:hypothetical protein
MNRHKDQLNLRSKSQVPKVVVTLVVTIASAALALAFGLALRPWFSRGAAEAKSQAQAPAPTSAAIASSALTEINNPAAVAGLLTQTVNGLEVTATNFRKEEGRLKADLCFVLRDNSDWVIWKPSLTYTQNGKEIELSDNYGSMPIELRGFPVNGQQRVITFLASGEKEIHSEPAAAGQMGRRCDTLYFEVPAEADLSNFSLVIHSIAAQPREGETCDFYLNKVQKALDDRKTGIKIQCTEESTGSGATVVSKPTSMSQEEAEKIVSSDEFFTVKGPWTFAGSLK